MNKMLYIRDLTGISKERNDYLYAATRRAAECEKALQATQTPAGHHQPVNM